VLIEQAWRTARTRAGLVDFKFHDLRHTCASYLAMSGASLLEIAEVLGHKKLEMVKRYAHLTEGHTRGVLQHMSEKHLGRPLGAQAAQPAPEEVLP
jgi:integrase